MSRVGARIRSARDTGMADTVHGAGGGDVPEPVVGVVSLSAGVTAGRAQWFRQRFDQVVHGTHIGAQRVEFGT